MTIDHDIDGGFVASPRPGVAAVALDGETVLYDERTASVHILSPTAALVWSCLDGQSSLDEIASDLAATFQADPATVSADVGTLVSELVAKGLLTHVDADKTAADLR